MEYIVMVFIVLPAIYSLSYAKHNWNKRNRMGAIGVLLLTAESIIFPMLYFIAS